MRSLKKGVLTKIGILKHFFNYTNGYVHKLFNCACKKPEKTQNYSGKILFFPNVAQKLINNKNKMKKMKSESGSRVGRTLIYDIN